MKNKLPYCNIRFVFQTKCKISNFFTFKDKIPSFLRSGIVYKFHCGSWNATYYGKSKRHFKVRMCKQLGVSVLTGRLRHMKSNVVQQSHTSSLNSDVMGCEKLHATDQVGVWWRAMIIPFRTPQFLFFCIEIYELYLNRN